MRKGIRFKCKALKRKKNHQKVHQVNLVLLRHLHQNLTANQDQEAPQVVQHVKRDAGKEIKGNRKKGKVRGIGVGK